MDRSSVTTLNTYSSWTQIRRLQMVYHNQQAKFKFDEIYLPTCQKGTQGTPILSMQHWKQWATLLYQHRFQLRGVQS